MANLARLGALAKPRWSESHCAKAILPNVIGETPVWSPGSVCTRLLGWKYRRRFANLESRLLHDHPNLQHDLCC
jgi:hypothetical protein